MSSSSDRRGLRALRRALLRRPSVATPQLVGRTVALDFAIIGLTTLLSTVWPDGSSHPRIGLIRALGLVSLLGAPVFLKLKRLDWWLVNGITLTATAGITFGIYLVGGGTMAAVSSVIYLLVVVQVFFAYARPMAWLHVGIAATLCALVLHGDKVVGAAALLVLLGVAVALAVLVSWLVRAADLAGIDYLTGLANRRGFESAAHSLLRTHPGRHRLAVIMIDVDDFRSVNERWGHAGGDDLLLSLARSWQLVLPEDALLARYGGDEFVVILVNRSDAELESILAMMRSGSDRSTFSAGVAWFAAPESLAMLLARADSAVYAAKSTGRARTVVAPGPTQTQTAHDILDALAADQFVIYYQPILDLTTGAVTMAEALIRWNHPERGLIGPDEFIRRAEQTGVITALGDWIVTRACRDASAWERNSSGDAISVSVNVSGLELYDRDYAARVRRSLSHAGLSPDRLILELVETDYNVESRVIADNLDRLAANGIKLAIDDFGTGYSSLKRLNQVQVRILKIDRSLVAAVTDRAQPMPLITAILAMARALALDVIAEGVETREQADWLRVHGCTLAQGYLYGPPLPRAPNRPAIHPTE